MKYLMTLTGIIFAITVWAAATRTIEGDRIRSSDRVKVWTFPASGDTLAGISATQTLTNKTISGASNDITGVILTSDVTGVLPLANGGTGASSLATGFIKSNGTVFSSTASIDATLSLSGAVPIANGGTGQTSKTNAYDGLSPNTTTGDITYYNGTDNVRLAGSSGVLQSTGAVNPTWTQAPTLTTPSMTTPTVSTSLNLTGGQIAFPAAQNSSAGANTLDDYEEGSWTPTVSCTTGSLTAYTSGGNYTFIGNTARIYFTFTITTLGTCGGNFQITNLPVTMPSEITFACRELAVNGNLNGISAAAGGTTAIFYIYNNSGSATANARYACSFVTAR